MTDPDRQPRTGTEVATRCPADDILYSMCWEDADVLLEGLNVAPGDVCISIASAGDNTLALLSRHPDRVLAVDINPAQLACLEIRIAALQELDHGEFLELIGSRPSAQRGELYARCRSKIVSAYAREVWDKRLPLVKRYGVGGVGKFESYWRIFRRYLLPLVHRRSVVEELLSRKSLEDRKAFYDQRWNSWRWRSLARLFGSRRMMAWLGRDRSFFNYVEGSTAEHFLRMAEYGLTTLSPADNPFLHWILTGRHGVVLPLAYRKQHYATIRNNLARLEYKQCSVEQISAECVANRQRVDCFNLSDIFEYMSVENQRAALLGMVEASRSGARMIFWNMMVPRSIPPDLEDRIQPLDDLAAPLRARDTGFFYRSLKLAEVR